MENTTLTRVKHPCFGEIRRLGYLREVKEARSYNWALDYIWCWG